MILHEQWQTPLCMHVRLVKYWLLDRRTTGRKHDSNITIQCSQKNWIASCPKNHHAVLVRHCIPWNVNLAAALWHCTVDTPPCSERLIPQNPTLRGFQQAVLHVSIFRNVVGVFSPEALLVFLVRCGSPLRSCRQPFWSQKHTHEHRKPSHNPFCSAEVQGKRPYDTKCSKNRNCSFGRRQRY